MDVCFVQSADIYLVLGTFGGFIQQIGAPKDVYNDPCNVFVAMFIGNPPMNVKEVATNGNSLVNGNERIALPETVRPAYKKFLEQRLAYFTELAEKADTMAEHELAAKIREFVHTYGKNSDRGALVSLCEALLQADKRGLYRFDEQGRDNLLKLFDCGDKGLRVQLAHIAAGLDDVDFVVKGILDGERSMMNSTARKDDGKTQNKGKTRTKNRLPPTLPRKTKPIFRNISIVTARKPPKATLCLSVSAPKTFTSRRNTTATRARRLPLR